MSDRYYIDVECGHRIETVGPLPKTRVNAYIRSRQMRTPHATFTVIKTDGSYRYRIKRAWAPSINEYRRQAAAKELLIEAECT